MKVQKVIIFIIVGSCLTVLGASYYLNKVQDRYQIVSPVGERNIIYRLDKRTGKIDVLERGFYSDEFIAQSEYKRLKESVEKSISEARSKEQKEFWDWQEERAKRLGRPFVFSDDNKLWWEWTLEKIKKTKLEKVGKSELEKEKSIPPPEGFVLDKK